MRNKKRRKCRCYELTGRKFSGCKKYIDNGNYYFCSACHRELSRLQAGTDSATVNTPYKLSH